MSTHTLKAMEQIGKPCHKYTGLTTALRTGALILGTGYGFSTLWTMRSNAQAIQKAEEDEFRHLVHEIRHNNAARVPHAHHHKHAAAAGASEEIDWDKPESIEAAIERISNQK